MELWLSKSEGERLRLVAELCEAERQLAFAGLRERYPAASEHEILMRYASRYLDRDTLIRAYSWDPDEH